MAGYSKTPLLKKLGIKPGMRVLPVASPVSYTELVGPLPENAEVVPSDYPEPIDFIHLFAADAKTLVSTFPVLKRTLAKKGMIWVSWIKKASQMETDISEQDVRSLGLELGLIDIKICAVDQDWSALKFVYRKKDR